MYKPAVRLFYQQKFEFAFDSVFVKLDQNINKYWDELKYQQKHFLLA